jgi:Putative prokaryotic signal transducing protein
MTEVERVRDPVRLSALRAILTDAGIDSVVFDAGMGGLFGGGVVQSRLMVSDDDIEMARHVLEQAGLGPET